MANSIWYLVGHFEGGINRGLPYACLDAFGGLDAYCLRMHTASECIRLPNAFSRRMHSAAHAMGPGPGPWAPHAARGLLYN